MFCSYLAIIVLSLSLVKYFLSVTAKKVICPFFYHLLKVSTLELKMKKVNLVKHFGPRLFPWTCVCAGANPFKRILLTLHCTLHNHKV